MKNLGNIIILICLLILVILFIISKNSTYHVYIGKLNDSNLELVDSSCGDDKLISIDGGCDHLSVICERFWFPIHYWSMCFDGRIESRWWYEK